MPLGQMVEVDGRNMSIYVERTGDTTLVFMSGLEALYWAQKYPNEVSAIIGLDMAVPEYYDSMNINIPIMHIAGWAANIGVTRFIPGISDSDAIKYHCIPIGTIN